MTWHYIQAINGVNGSAVTIHNKTTGAVVMWRAQYRNFGAFQTLVGNFVTDVSR